MPISMDFLSDWLFVRSSAPDAESTHEDIAGVFFRRKMQSRFFIPISRIEARTGLDEHMEPIAFIMVCCTIPGGDERHDSRDGHRHNALRGCAIAIGFSDFGNACLNESAAGQSRYGGPLPRDAMRHLLRSSTASIPVLRATGLLIVLISPYRTKGYQDRCGDHREGFPIDITSIFQYP